MTPLSEYVDECEPRCPPPCRSVFDRVVVSHLVTGGTRVQWDLLPTFTDARPLEFQLQVGNTPDNNADDWQDVGLPVVDQYVARDSEQRVFGKTNFINYRVKLTTAQGEYLSDPVAGLGTLDRRSWRLAREIVRQRQVAFRWGPGGQVGYLLKRRWVGEDCPDCVDYQTGESRNPDCPSCFGTGKRCGYYYPVDCVWAELSPRTTRTMITDGRGTTNDVTVSATMLGVYLMDEDDVWVAAKTDDRYFVHQVQNVAEYRGVPLVSQVELRLIPYSSPIYGIEIPQQLQDLGLA